VLGVLAALLYAPTLGFGYVWDDIPLITSNPWITGDTGLWQLMGADSHLHIYWRPLTMASMWLGWRVADGAAWPLHGMQILFHGLATALVFVWLCTLLGRRRLAAVAALLFALHPMNVETVSFIAARDNILMLIGILTGALACELQRRQVSPWKPLLLFTAGTVLALGSKESGALIIGIPVLYALLDMAQERPGRSWYTWGIMTGIAAVLTIGFFFVRSMILTSGSGGATVVLNIELPARVAHHAGFLLGKALFPIGHNPDYYHGLEHYTLSHVITGVVTIAAMVAGAVMLWKRNMHRYLLVLGVTLLLALPFVGIILPSGRTFSESWLYGLLPGVCVLLASLPEYLYKKRRSLAAALVLFSLLGWFAASDVSGMQIWKSQDTLTEASLAADPKNPRALNLAGESFKRRGESQYALRYFKAAIAVDPGYGYAYENHAMLLMRNGFMKEAEQQIDAGMAKASWFVRLRGLKAKLLMKRGKAQEALNLLQHTPPNHYSLPEYDRLMAEALMLCGRQAEGMDLLKQYIGKHPHDELAKQMLKQSAAAGTTGNP